MSTPIPACVPQRPDPADLAVPIIQWLTSDGLVDYPKAVSFMETRVAAIRDGTATEAIWLLEHPPLYTAGTSASAGELLQPGRFPVYPSGRGGKYTYHGPGQRVVYVMLDLKRRGGDVRAFVRALEGWIIATLAQFGVHGERREGRVGIWVTTATGEAKIAALGVRVRRWVSYHGIAINIEPNLEHFSGIVPCGLATFGVTSLADLGVGAHIADVDRALRKTITSVVGDAPCQLEDGLLRA